MLTDWNDGLGSVGCWAWLLLGSWAGRGRWQPGVVSVGNAGLLLVGRLGSIGKVVTNSFGGLLLVGRHSWDGGVVSGGPGCVSLVWWLSRRDLGSW